MKRLLFLSLMLSLLCLASPISSFAITVQIGDVDGFGIPATDIATHAQVEGTCGDGLAPHCGSIGSKSEGRQWWVADLAPNGGDNGILEPGDLLLDMYGKSGGLPDRRTTAWDVFDFREPEEKSAEAESTGSNYTDVAISKFFGFYYANDPNHPDPEPLDVGIDADFKFVFDVDENDPDYGHDHYFSIVYGDYDVGEMEIYIAGQAIPLIANQDVQINGKEANGYIGLAYALIPWSELEDGEVTVNIYAPNEPYVAFDVAGIAPQPGFPGITNDFDLPVLGVAKAASSVVPQADDYIVVYDIVVENLGDVVLSNVQLTEDLSATFDDPTSSFVVDSVVISAGNDLQVNPNFNGTSDTALLQGTASLGLGESSTIRLTVTVTPGTDFGPFENTVLATAVDPLGNPVTDDSTDGMDPDPNGDGVPNESSPTVISFAAGQPQITIEKSTATPQVANGATATFSIVVTNSGNLALSNVTVSDAQTPACERQIGDLAVGATVSYDCSTGPLSADFTNTASVSGASAAGSVSDSDDAVVDVLNPVLGVAKAASSVVPQADDYIVVYDIVVENLGDVVLSNVQLTEDLSATFDDPTSSFVVDSVVISAGNDLQVNPNFNGTSDTALLQGTASLGLGESSTIRLTVTVTPGADLGPFENTVLATAVDPLGNPVTDDSTDGMDPDPNGDGVPNESSPTVISFAAGQPQITIEKSTATPQVANGATATFSIVVTNSGNLALSNVTVSDAQTPACERQIGDLAVGATVSYDCSTGPLSAGFTNTASVSGASAAGSVSDSDDAVVVVITPDPSPETPSVPEPGTLLLLGLGLGGLLALSRRRIKR